ncbi:hypothetical protein ACFQ10_18195 [Streptomyces indonesiensis]
MRSLVPPPLPLPSSLWSPSRPVPIASELATATAAAPARTAATTLRLLLR